MKPLMKVRKHTVYSDGLNSQLTFSKFQVNYISYCACRSRESYVIQQNEFENSGPREFVIDCNNIVVGEPETPLHDSQKKSIGNQVSDMQFQNKKQFEKLVENQRDLNVSGKMKFGIMELVYLIVLVLILFLETN